MIQLGAANPNAVVRISQHGELAELVHQPPGAEPYLPFEATSDSALQLSDAQAHAQPRFLGTAATGPVALANHMGVPTYGDTGPLARAQHVGTASRAITGQLAIATHGVVPVGQP